MTKCVCEEKNRSFVDKISKLKTSTVLLLFRIVLVSWAFCVFIWNSRFFFFNSLRNCIESLMGMVLNLWIAFGRTGIFTVLSLLFQDHKGLLIAWFLLQFPFSVSLSFHGTRLSLSWLDLFQDNFWGSREWNCFPDFLLCVSVVCE